jgi:hypothetical protein
MSLTKDVVNKARVILLEDVPRRDPVQIMSCTDSGTSRTTASFSCTIYLNFSINDLFETSKYDDGGECRLVMTSGRAYGRSESESELGMSIH